jgi:hypothetical protein
MHKLLTGFAAASALALFASTAPACDYHDMLTNAGHNEQVVAMSSSDGQRPPVTDTNVGKMQPTTATPTCAAGDKDCAATPAK